MFHVCFTDGRSSGRYSKVIDILVKKLEDHWSILCSLNLCFSSYKNGRQLRVLYNEYPSMRRFDFRVPLVVYIRDLLLRRRQLLTRFPYGRILLFYECVTVAKSRICNTDSDLDTRTYEGRIKQLLTLFDEGCRCAVRSAPELQWLKTQIDSDCLPRHLLQPTVLIHSKEIVSAKVVIKMYPHMGFPPPYRTKCNTWRPTIKNE